MRNLKYILVTILFGALILTSSTQVAVAAPVWSDNFDDGNLTDWLRWGVNATDGTLRWAKNWTYGFAVHNSSVKVGTWEFDLIEHELSATDNRTRIRFISSVNRANLVPFDYYYLELTRVSTISGHKPRYTLFKENATVGEVLATYDGPESELTTHHIRISRESVMGQIRVYLNGTRIIEAFGDIPANDPARTDPVLHIALAVDTAVDNIVVDDEFEPLPTPTTTTGPTTPTTPTGTGTPPIPMEYLLIGAGVIVVIVVLVIIFKQRG